MQVRNAFLFLVLFLVVGAYAFMPMDLRPERQRAAIIASPFLYTFNSPGVLNETARMGDSTSPYWWVNSGGRLLIKDGIGTTMVGGAPLLDRWRIAYALSNPTDTDGGRHPQNLFRSVSRHSWENARVEAQFKIQKDNWSQSPNRNASNGLLLMTRYLHSDTLYYAGLRVDGYAVIKKKYDGTYYTMAQKRMYAGNYVQGGKVNVLPHGRWLGLRSETVTNADGSVTIRLYQEGADGSWKKILESEDSGQYGGTAPISGKGYIGIRTDFMDVAFDAFRAETLSL
jgi:hypothetical protein